MMYVVFYHRMKSIFLQFFILSQLTMNILVYFNKSVYYNIAVQYTCLLCYALKEFVNHWMKYHLNVLFIKNSMIVSWVGYIDKIDID